MPKAEETVLEIDLSALEHNYHYLRSQVDSTVKFMAVVKASGYGSAVAEIAKKLVSLGADYFAVAYTSEGVHLRNSGIEIPILVLHPQSVNFKTLIGYRLEPNLYSKFVLQKFIRLAENMGEKDYPVHIKFNTGMNRLGFSEDETAIVQDLLQKTNSITAAGLFSHLSASEDWRERSFTLDQIYCFRRIATILCEGLDTRPLLHICNTSGILNYPEAGFDMVRSGIGLYGFGNDTQQDKQFRPVGTLKTIISQIHELESGASVGYNRAFIASGPVRTATLPIGHADGIKRQFGNNRAGVFIRGKYAPIIGNVCMDMIMVNITGINCEEGDEVIVFGGPQHAARFAAKGDTISYELLAGISQRVKRVVLE